MEMLRASVLVVDDESGIRRLLYEVLADKNVQVYLASNGQEALAIVKDKKPEIILADWHMPGISGRELLRNFKNVGNNATVIIMTAFEKEDVGYSENWNNYHYLIKPFDIFEVKSLIHKILHERYWQANNNEQAL